MPIPLLLKSLFSWYVKYRGFAKILTKIEGLLNRPDLRLTLDYKEDYQLINKIYCDIPFEKILKLHDVVNYLNNNPDLLALNKNCVQKKLNESIKKKINGSYEKNFKIIMEMKKEIYEMI